MEDRMLYNIALTKIPGIGSRRTRSLVNYCDNVQQYFQQPDMVNEVPGLAAYGKAFRDTSQYLESAEQELYCLQKHQIRPLFLTDDAYPRRLRHIPDSPPLLYYKGTADLNAPRMLAIVGTRNATEYGKRILEHIISALAEYDVTIVSGLAFGIDIAAHRQALRVGLPTIGVMGSGHRYIYPAEHRQTARMMEIQGGLLTELPYDTGPEREHFPMRNRILAGMSDAVLVVESAEKGGAMITANLAHKYGRNVLAIPGRVSDTYSAGCNKLIKTHKAQAVSDAGDILKIMNWGRAHKARQRRLFESLSAAEKQVVKLLQNTESKFVDELAATLRVPPGKMASYLLSLELKGVVKCLPGNRYTLV